MIGTWLGVFSGLSLSILSIPLLISVYVDWVYDTRKESVWNGFYFIFLFFLGIFTTIINFMITRKSFLWIISDIFYLGLVVLILPISVKSNVENWRRFHRPKKRELPLGFDFETALHNLHLCLRFDENLIEKSDLFHSISKKQVNNDSILSEIEFSFLEDFQRMPQQTSVRLALFANPKLLAKSELYILHKALFDSCAAIREEAIITLAYLGYQESLPFLYELKDMNLSITEQQYITQAIRVIEGVSSFKREKYLRYWL